VTGVRLGALGVTSILHGNWSLGKRRSRWKGIKLATCRDVNWTELTCNHIDWRALVLSVMDPWVLFADSGFLSVLNFYFFYWILWGVCHEMLDISLGMGSAFRCILLDRKATMFSKLWICAVVIFPYNCVENSHCPEIGKKSAIVPLLPQRRCKVYFCIYENSQHTEIDLREDNWFSV